MKRRFYFLLFSIGLIFLSGSLTQVLACSCRQQQPVCEAFGSSKAVFVGEVVEGKSAERMSDMIGAKSRDNSFVFKVSQNFLGAEEDKTITIHTGFGFGDCGYPFQKGEKYLVYAYEHDGKLYTSICSRTRPAASVEDDFEELKYLLLTSGAKIYGTANLYENINSSEEERPPLAKLKIQIEQTDGEKKKYEVVTDEKGNYQLTGLPTGKYKIIPSLKKGLMVEDYQTNEFSLNDKGCARNDLLVKNDSRITGILVDSDGKPVNGLGINLLPPSAKISPEYPDLFNGRTYSGSDGSFTFYNVPPGKYLIVANYGFTPTAKAPFPLSFYKTEGESSNGTIIEIGLGQEIEGLVVKLNPRLPLREVRGKVLWKDGKPAAEVFINLRDVEAQYNIADAKSDKSGNFVIKGFPGRKYILQALIDKVINGQETEFEAKDIEFVLNEKTGEFKLILERKVEE